MCKHFSDIKLPIVKHNMQKKIQKSVYKLTKKSMKEKMQPSQSIPKRVCEKWPDGTLGQINNNDIIALITEIIQFNY